MLADAAGAFAFLTVLPVDRWATGKHPGRSFAYYPLVGLVIGMALSLAASIPLLSLEMRAFWTLVVWVLLTGGLHLDGFGDACDGLLATAPPERRLEIMKDPRSGSWAVIGLLLLLLGKWAALRGVTPGLLLLPPVLGRWAMVLAVAGYPYARKTGVGAYFREGFGRVQLVVASVICIAIVAAALATAPSKLHVVLAFSAALVLVYFGGRWAAERLGGGLTGDIYGALCEATELLCLAILSLG